MIRLLAAPLAIVPRAAPDAAARPRRAPAPARRRFAATVGAVVLRLGRPLSARVRRSARALAGRRPAAFLTAAALLALLAGPAAAFSNCQAIAGRIPAARVILAATGGAAAHEVEIRYVAHATFRITAPDGTVIATDFAGYGGEGPLPDIVTMNHAHSSHYTPFPDPGIPHVLRGWNPDGGKAEHLLTVGEVLVRNVPTDIRNWSGIEESGNSIFIFEIAGLCIGHLGHLHQPLSDEQVAEIGRLDVVFVPIDGTYTMNQATMMEVLKRLRAQLAIPMHWFGQSTLTAFLDRTRADGIAVEYAGTDTIRVSLNSLPAVPTFRVLDRERGY
jgi:L-ascorbate metabolism protein UlaG (beta-lactamase superfamily)